MKRFLPWIVSGVFLVSVVTSALVAQPRSSRGVDLKAFGQLPVVMSGGVHPIDAAARLSLRRIRGTERVPIESYSARTFWRIPRALGATEWLLEVMTTPEADTRAIFAVADRAVAAKLGLSMPRFGRAYYSFADLRPKLQQITQEAGRIDALDAARRQQWERDWLALHNAITIYARLRTTFQPDAVKTATGGFRYDFATQLVKYQQYLKPLAAAAQARERRQQLPVDPEAQNGVRAFASRFVSSGQAGFIAMVPPADASKASDGWQTIGTAIVDSTKQGRLRPAVVAYARISAAFASGQQDVFDREVATYGTWLRQRGFSAVANRTRSEYRFTAIQPFVKAAGLYLVALVLFGAALVRRDQSMRRAAAPVFAVGSGLHALGLLWLATIAGGLPPMNAYIGALSFGLVVTLTAAAAAWMRQVPFMVAPIAGLGTIVIAQGSAGSVLQLGRDLVDVPLLLAVIVVLMMLSVIRSGGAGRPLRRRDASVLAAQIQ